MCGIKIRHLNAIRRRRGMESPNFHSRDSTALREGELERVTSAMHQLSNPSSLDSAEIRTGKS